MAESEEFNAPNEIITPTDYEIKYKWWENDEEQKKHTVEDYTKELINMKNEISNFFNNSENGSYLQYLKNVDGIKDLFEDIVQKDSEGNLILDKNAKIIKETRLWQYLYFFDNVTLDNWYNLAIGDFDNTLKECCGIDDEWNSAKIYYEVKEKKGEIEDGTD